MDNDLMWDYEITPMRWAPEADSEVVGIYFNYTVHEALGTVGDYTQVRIGDITGFLPTKLLQDTDTNMRIQWVNGYVTLRGNDEGVFPIYFQPSLDAKVMIEIVLPYYYWENPIRPSFLGALPDGWLHVSVFDETDGSMQYGYARADDVNISVYSQCIGTASNQTVAALKALPDDNSATIATLYSGATVFKVYTAPLVPGWVRVRVGDLAGYIHEQDLDVYYESTSLYTEPTTYAISDCAPLYASVQGTYAAAVVSNEAEILVWGLVENRLLVCVGIEGEGWIGYMDTADVLPYGDAMYRWGVLTSDQPSYEDASFEIFYDHTYPVGTRVVVLHYVMPDGSIKYRISEDEKSTGWANCLMYEWMEEYNDTQLIWSYFPADAIALFDGREN